jgi:hypothetical protein
MYSPNLELMNEDVGVAIGIARHRIGNITHSAQRWSSVSYSGLDEGLEGALRSCLGMPAQTDRYRLSEPTLTLTSSTLPGALAFLCDARRPYPLEAR